MATRVSDGRKLCVNVSVLCEFLLLAETRCSPAQPNVIFQSIADGKAFGAPQGSPSVDLSGRGYSFISMG